MPLSPLLPIAGVAAASLAREAVAAVGSGLSFATELVRQGRGGGATADDNEEHAPNPLTAAVAQFAQRLQQRLASIGQSLSGPVELAADGLGGIDVSGGERDKSLVEQLLAGDDSLAEQFYALAEASQSHSGQSRHEFALLLDGDIAEAIAKP